MRLFKKRNYALEELASIVGPLAHAHNITAVSLFGSRATGEYTRESDYDFLIETNDDFDFHDYCRFVEGLEKMLGSVDVVYGSCLKDDGFGRRVRREAVRVC